MLEIVNVGNLRRIVDQKVLKERRGQKILCPTKRSPSQKKEGVCIWLLQVHSQKVRFG